MVMVGPAEDYYAPDGVWRTARKVHTCELCQRSIVPKERHFEYLTEVRPHTSGPRYCVECYGECFMLATGHLRKPRS